jgi:hypothetical protein
LFKLLILLWRKLRHKFELVVSGHCQRVRIKSPQNTVTKRALSVAKLHFDMLVSLNNLKEITKVMELLEGANDGFLVSQLPG